MQWRSFALGRVGQLVSWLVGQEKLRSWLVGRGKLDSWTGKAEKLVSWTVGQLERKSLIAIQTNHL